MVCVGIQGVDRSFFASLRNSSKSQNIDACVILHHISSPPTAARRELSNPRSASSCYLIGRPAFPQDLPTAISPAGDRICSAPDDAEEFLNLLRISSRAICIGEVVSRGKRPKIPRETATELELAESVRPCSTLIQRPLPLPPYALPPPSNGHQWAAYTAYHQEKITMCSTVISFRRQSP